MKISTIIILCSAFIILTSNVFAAPHKLECKISFYHDASDRIVDLVLSIDNLGQSNQKTYLNAPKIEGVKFTPPNNIDLPNYELILTHTILGGVEIEVKSLLINKNTPKPLSMGEITLNSMNSILDYDSTGSSRSLDISCKAIN